MCNHVQELEKWKNLKNAKLKNSMAEKSPDGYL